MHIIQIKDQVITADYYRDGRLAVIMLYNEVKFFKELYKYNTGSVSNSFSPSSVPIVDIMDSVG